MGERKSLYHYDNYREFLKDTYQAKKAESGRFSFQVFSRMAGIKAGNYLKLVMDGERNLTPDSIEKFSRGLKLNREESRYFKHLVLLNQAKTPQERQLHAEEILKVRSYRKLHTLSQAQYEYFTHWYYVAIRELIGLPGFVEDLAWIARQVKPAITVAEARKALEVLLALGLIARDETGRLVLSQPHISTPDEVVSAALAQGHREVIRLASESIERFPRENRDISAVSFSSSEETIRKIKSVISEFRKKILEIAAEEPAPDRICQLNMQLFPIAQIEEAEGKEGSK